MSNSIQIPSHFIKAQISELVDQVKARIEVFGFGVWPLTPDTEHGIPAGFYTIGFTRIGLPEFYVSGLPAHSAHADEIIKNLKELYSYARDTAMGISAMDLCMQVNMVETDENLIKAYQWRPVDPIRMMYGQCLTLRNWADSVGLTELVSGVQIVHRESEQVDFPMTSTPNQLLLDYVPFGCKSFTSQYVEQVVN